MEGLFHKRKSKPMLIAGPCSVETEAQIMQTALELSKYNQLDLLRGGIWKPRTKPNSFEGIGEIGLEWLVQAGKAINIPTTTEVANPKHVEAALKAGVDVLWIGARTTVNPFAVQDLADALKGVSVPVLVKNPVNPDLELWIGALERFQKAGTRDLAAIHRGFSIYKHPTFRNVPSWEIPIAFMDRLPDIPLFNDPSHITGNRKNLLAVAQKALDLNFDGLMIESHIDPTNAWSDADQQVTPNDLSELISMLVLRTLGKHEESNEFVELIREKIQELDDRLFELLTTRMVFSEELGEYKKTHNITILQSEHWRKIISKRLELASQYKLSEEFIRSIMDAIHQESIQHQNRVMNANNILK